MPQRRVALRRPLATGLVLALFLLSPAARADTATDDVLLRGLDLVVQRYWRPEEVVLSTLLASGLQRLERAGDRVLVTGPDGEGRYRVTVDEASQAFATRDVGEPAAVVGRMREAMAFVDGQLADGEASTDLEVLALQGLLKPLDRHCRVIDKRKLADFEARYRGTLSGIGARIGKRADVLTVVKVYEDSPALDAGLRDGDQVTHIDGVSTLNMHVSDAIARIRGPEGLQVTLTVRRPGEEGRRVFPIVRRKVVLPTIDARLLDERYALMVLDHFSQRTADEFERKLLELAEARSGQLGGVIIDLRGNQGGSMLHASRIVNYFTDSGSILVTQGADGGAVKGLRHRVDAAAEETIAPWPVVVLVDHKTASGSEILAGGLKFNDRALVIGTQTFGKGTVQKPYELREQLQMKLTVARYLVAEDVWLSEVGITPDLVLGEVYVDDDGVDFPDVMLDPLVDPDLPHADWKPTRSGLNSEPSLRLAYPYLAWGGDGYRDPAVEGWQPDLAVVLARRILAGGGRDRTALLATARGVVDEETGTQNQRLLDAMVEQGIEWSPGPPRWMDLSPAREEAHLAVMRGPSPPGVEVAFEGTELRAGETTELRVRVTNRGNQTLKHLRARSMSERGILDGLSFVLGDIAPGATASCSVPIAVSARTQTRIDEVRVYLVDDDGPLGGPAGVRITTLGTDTPRLALAVSAGATEEEDGSRLVRFEIAVRNESEVESGRVRVSFDNPGVEGVELQESHRTLDGLGGGDEGPVTLEVRFRPGAPATPLVLDAQDRDFGVGTAVELPVDPVALEASVGDYRPPTISLRGGDRPLQAEETLRFEAEASDDEGMARVVVWMGSDKIQVIEGTGKGAGRKTIPVAVDLALQPGINAVRLVAIDATGIRSERRFSVLGG